MLVLEVVVTCNILVLRISLEAESAHCFPRIACNVPSCPSIPDIDSGMKPNTAISLLSLPKVAKATRLVEFHGPNRWMELQDQKITLQSVTWDARNGIDSPYRGPRVLHSISAT